MERAKKSVAGDNIYIAHLADAINTKNNARDIVISAVVDYLWKMGSRQL